MRLTTTHDGSNSMCSTDNMMKSELMISLRNRLLYFAILLLVAVATVLPIMRMSRAQSPPPAQSQAKKEKLRHFDAQISSNATELLEDGRQTFRIDTFGDEAFWGGTLQLHRAIEGAGLGGVGPGISPNAALDLGLKVDLDALSQPLINQLKQGKVNLDDPATTVALLKLDALLGIKGFF
jgi:hypothetical protein